MDRTINNNTVGHNDFMAERPPQEKRVLLLAPTPHDAELSVDVLAEAGLVCTVCADPEALRRELEQGAGCLLLAESELLLEGVSRLTDSLLRQPAWSDLPVIVLTRGGAVESPKLLSMTQALGNVTLLEMPVRISTLLSSLRTALRARARQYQIRDQIEAQKKIEAALSAEHAFLRQVIDATPSMIFVKHWDGRFILVNEALAHCYGATPLSVVGKTDADFNSNLDELERFQRDDREVISTRSEKQIPEEKVTFANGEVHWFSTFKVPLINAGGECDKVLGVASDITEHKRAEDALHEANAQLREADRRKDEFLAMLAHELRNPLAPIRNAAQVLRLAAPQEAILQRQRDIIDRQVTHMAHLLDDLLDVSRVTRGNVHLKQEPVPLTEVLARAVETANPLIEARHHTLTVSPPAERPERLCVLGDSDRLFQIVGNLLSNAAKYTEEGGTIWLEAGREGDEAVIRVRDTGVGLAPDMLHKVFDLFTQVERSLDRSQGGLGLGLTLVKNLIQMHGGSVEAHSAGLGRGSEFVVRLPAMSESQSSGQPEAEGSVQAETRSRRILVVDDVADTVNSLAELLGLFGHEVRTAYEGASVLSIARQFRPDVVLLDIGMPGQDGYHVARQIRGDAELKDVLLIALTGYGQEEDRRLAQQAGFDHLITKPVDFNDLKALLDHPFQG